MGFSKLDLFHLEFDIISIPSPNHSPQKRGVDPICIILHCIGFDFPNSLSQLILHEKEGGFGVSSHFFIPQVPYSEIPELKKYSVKYPNQVPVIQLVDLEFSAKHAGKSGWSNWNSFPDCSLGLNACSLGIEFHSPAYLDTSLNNPNFGTFSESQIEVGIQLLQVLTGHFQIPKQNILGHSDIAPQRKTDPGLNFPWQDLSAKGFGIPYLTNVPTKPDWKSYSILEIQKQLKTIGYLCPLSGILDEETQNVIAAFQLHFMNHRPWTKTLDDSFVSHLFCLESPSQFV